MRAIDAPAIAVSRAWAKGPRRSYDLQGLRIKHGVYEL